MVRHQKRIRETIKKIELSVKNRVRKSNGYVRNSFTQSVKNTYVSHDNQNSGNAQIPIPYSLPDKLVSEEDRAMLEIQLQALPDDIAVSIVRQLSQGVRAGSVRNPVGYTLQLLKSAREGRYNAIVSAEVYREKIRKPKSEPVSVPGSNPSQKRVRAADIRGPKTAPEVALKYLQGIRRTLAGIAD